MLTVGEDKRGKKAETGDASASSMQADAVTRRVPWLAERSEATTFRQQGQTLQMTVNCSEGGALPSIAAATRCVAGLLKGIIPERPQLSEKSSTRTYLRTLSSHRPNAPADGDTERMAVVGSERWPVESAIKEAKGQTGLDESEGRNWKHWHHHTTLSMLAHAFLTCARMTWAKTHPTPFGTENAEARGSGGKGTAA